MAVPGIIIQARIWAERFPGKVLADLGGETVLQHVVRRCKMVGGPVIVATPDAALLPLAREYGAEVFMGDEQDVLKRYIDCAKSFGITHVIRVTADCPFLDPWLIWQWQDELEGKTFHYASNVIHRTYPYGLDMEFIPLEILELIHPMATKKQREHVTLYIRENLSQFDSMSLCNPYGKYTHMDWRLDYKEDLTYLRALYISGGNTIMPWEDMVKLHSYAEHLRAFAVDGHSPGRTPETDGGHAAKSADTPDDGAGPAWHERRYSEPPSSS